MFHNLYDLNHGIINIIQIPGIILLVSIFLLELESLLA